MRGGGEPPDKRASEPTREQEQESNTHTHTTHRRRTEPNRVNASAHTEAPRSRSRTQESERRQQADRRTGPTKERLQKRAAERASKANGPNVNKPSKNPCKHCSFKFKPTKPSGLCLYQVISFVNSILLNQQPHTTLTQNPAPQPLANTTLILPPQP